MALPNTVFILLTERRYSSNKLVHRYMTRKILFAMMLLWTGFACAQENYQMAGPYEVVARDGKYAYTKGGSERDMWTAWQCAQQGHADKALEIINAYAETLQRFDGHDAPLCAIQGYWLVRAMTILQSHATAKWGNMIRRTMLPMIDKFEADSPYANGNWGAIVNRLRMACGIFLQDSTVYQASIDYFLHANDNGSLPRYISKTGQCQETGRDQGHAQLGLGALCETCEMAWEQGNDLWGALGNRMMKGIEYSARYNLGYKVPFETWTDCTGLYNEWTEPGSMGRGRIRCIYDLPYNHYVGRRHQPMPATSLVLGHYVRPEGAGFTCDNPGFGSLLFYQGTEVDAFTAVPSPITYKVNNRRPYDVVSEPVIRLADAPRLSLVRTVDCWPEYWDLEPVRKEGSVFEYEPRGARSRNGYTFADGAVATTFLVRETPGLPAFVDGGASTPALPPFSISPLPEKDGPALSTDYNVEIRRAAAGDEAWTSVPVLRCNVDTRRVQQAAFAEFDMSEPVVVRITNHRPEQAADVDVRPHSRGLRVERQNDSIVLLRLDRPEYLSLEFGNERLHNLHLLVNAPLTEHHSPAEPKAIDWVAPNSQDVFVEGARLIYFGPGVHKPKDLPSEEIKIPSNCTVYLAPGAVVKARLIVDRAENVRIVGRGILDHPLRGIEIT